MSSSFTGEELVLFGSIEREPNNPQRRGGYDIIATVTGPRQNLVTFRKDRVLGIWVNVNSRVFDNVPRLSRRAGKPTARDDHQCRNAAPPAARPRQCRVAAARRRHHRGFGARRPVPPGVPEARQQQSLYREATNGVTFLTPTLYRASIPLPAETPVGHYEIDVRLFVDGAPIARTNSAFEVYKSGLEQLVTAAARDHGLLYGLTTAMMALVTGWLASVVFRRD